MYLLWAAFGVLGIIEWIKSLIVAVEGAKKDWHPIVWVIASLVFSFVVAAAADGGVYQVLTNGIFILAINEIIGYNVIVKSIFFLVDKVTGQDDKAPESKA